MQKRTFGQNRGSERLPVASASNAVQRIWSVYDLVGSSGLILDSLRQLSLPHFVKEFDSSGQLIRRPVDKEAS